MTEISRRKSEHIDVVLDGQPGGREGGSVLGRGGRTGFELVEFEHVALPELALDEIDLSCGFLGRRMAAPLLISSMTGGPERASAINRSIAEAAGVLGIAFAVGSQRIALEHGGAGGFDRGLRAAAGPVPILANFGAAQLATWDGVAMAERAIEMIDADALIVHLNPLQEAVQAGGDRDWRGLADKIGLLARGCSRPIVIKEVGAGISGTLARRLVDAGVAAIDVAGAGGTSWAAVEGARAVDPAQRAIAAAFQDWGIPTATAIVDARAHCPDTPLIASGGIRTGVDVAKAIRLGADIAGQAAGVLASAIEGPAAVIGHMRVVIEQLRIACFCTGSRDLAALRSARLIGGGGAAT
jgi:isopentenyl-diphosphate delta-isomerase